MFGIKLHKFIREKKIYIPPKKKNALKQKHQTTENLKNELNMKNSVLYNIYYLLFRRTLRIFSLSCFAVLSHNFHLFWHKVPNWMSSKLVVPQAIVH